MRADRGIGRRGRNVAPAGAALAAAALLAAGAADAARAEEGAPPEAAPAASQPAPRVALEELLQLPDSIQYGAERRGGATRSEWRARFVEAEAQLAEARSALEKAQAQLEEEAGETESWQMAAPGGSVAPAAETSLNYGLRQEIRRQRSEVESAERRLRELQIEANLAGVPESWRQRPEQP